MFRQYGQLLLLTLVHATADLFGGLLGAILPVLVTHHRLPLSSMLAVITVLGFSSNGFQIMAGHLPLRGEASWPISVGLLLAGVIPLIALVPPGPWAWFFLLGLLVIGGAGIALVHPNGLRAVYRLDRIPASFATACFMVGGFAGFAGGAWVSSALVDRFHVRGLLFLFPLAILAASAIPLTGIRLASDPPRSSTSASEPPENRKNHFPPFPYVFGMGFTAATASLIVTNLLPTRLHELGHTLPFCGQSIFLFGIGGALGSLLWGAFAARRGFGLALHLSLGIGIPILALYLFVAAHGWARILISASGLFLYPSFPLIVTLARFSPSSLSLAQRMGWIVGGTWGIAGILIILIGPFIEKIGLAPFVHLSWVFYMICLLIFLRAGRTTHAQFFKIKGKTLTHTPAH